MKHHAKGVYKHQTGKWRVDIMVDGERMTKVCYSYDEAIHAADYMRSFLKLKYQGQKGQSMYMINKNGQIQNEGRIIARTNEVAQNAHVNALQTFTFPAAGQEVRIIKKEGGEPWFVAKDVCDCLGIKNGRDAVAALDEDEKGVAFSDTRGGRQKVTTISESGLYALIFRSNKPEARVFSKWVRAEVLPAIRRTGGYIIANPEESPEILMARALFVARDSIDRLNQQLEVAQPKIEAYEVLYNAEGDCTLTEAAKHFDMSAQRLNDILRKEQWLFKNALDRHNHPITPVNLPCQHIIDRGYAIVKSRTSKRGYRCTQTYITPRGLIAIERLLRKRFDA